MIDSPRSATVRAVAELAKKSKRMAQGRFILEGPQAVQEALENRPDLVVALYATPEAGLRHPAIIEAAEKARVVLTSTSSRAIAAMADTVNPQGVIAVGRQEIKSLSEIVAGKPRLLAILHEVRDPGNAGTVLRAADAAGADAVIFSGESVDPYHPKVVRSTTGSLFHLSVAVENSLETTVAMLRESGLRVLAADVGGIELDSASPQLADSTAWLFGNEARGLSADQLAAADQVLRLPIFGKAESLNLATAASVCLYLSAFAQRARPDGDPR